MSPLSSQSTDATSREQRTAGPHSDRQTGPGGREYWLGTVQTAGGRGVGLRPPVRPVPQSRTSRAIPVRFCADRLAPSPLGPAAASAKAAPVVPSGCRGRFVVAGTAGIRGSVPPFSTLGQQDDRITGFASSISASARRRSRRTRRVTRVKKGVWCWRSDPLVARPCKTNLRDVESGKEE